MDAEEGFVSSPISNKISRKSTGKLARSMKMMVLQRSLVDDRIQGIVISLANGEMI
jgi:hypothetical protein